MKVRFLLVLAVVLVGLSATLVYADSANAVSVNPNSISVPPVSLPAIVCASGVGGARCQFIIHSQADLAYLQQLCVANKLPATACKFINNASNLTFSNAQACAITLALSVQDISQSCTALDGSRRRNRICTRVLNTKNPATTVSTAKKYQAVPPSVIAANGASIVPSGFTCSAAINTASEWASIGVTVANLSANLPTSFQMASTGHRWG